MVQWLAKETLYGFSLGLSVLATAALALVFPECTPGYLSIRLGSNHTSAAINQALSSSPPMEQKQTVTVTSPALNLQQQLLLFQLQLNNGDRA